MKIARRILRYFFYLVAIVFAAAIGALVVLTMTERGRDNLAGLVSTMASSPDRKVMIGDIDGIWSGALKVGHVTVEDRNGPWLVLRDVAVDWSPLALLSKTFSAERISAGRIELARLPLAGTEAKHESGGASLPVSVDIKQIDLPDIALGKDLAGAGIAELSAKGSLKADASPLAVQTVLNVARRDGKQGSIAASAHFAPADDRLDLDLKASEPAGGIIANLLGLPGAPPVDITLSGKGPLADWSGMGSFAVDGQVVTQLSARHQLTDKGNRVEAKGEGEFERFLPAMLKPLLAGKASFDLAATAIGAGGIQIEHASIDSDAIQATAKGSYDPKTATDLAVEVAAKSAPVVLSLPTGGAPITVTLNTITARAFGDGRQPAIDLAGSFVSLITGGTELRDFTTQMHSDGFDIQNRSGPVKLTLAAGNLKTDVATLAPLAAGKLLADLSGTVGQDEISLDQGTLRSDALNASVTAKVGLADLAMTLSMKADAVASALPPQLRPVLGERVQFSATATRDPRGSFAANSISLTSGTLSASGTASATGTDIQADLKGSLGDISPLSSLAGTDIAGGVAFSLNATGATTAPDFSVTASSDSLRASGREVKNVKLNAKGKADLAEPAADLSLTGTVDGEPLDIAAALATVDGRKQINGLSLALGASKLTGDLALGDDFLPVGTLTLDVPDIAPLASLAGQSASGDIKGTIRFSRDGDVPAVSIDAASFSIARGDIAAKNIAVNAAITNYVAAPGISGTIKADSVTSGSTVVSGISVDLKQDGGWTGFSGGATVAGIPATIAGRAKFVDGVTTVELASGNATVKGIKAAVAGSSTIEVEDGAASIDRLALDIGDGSVVVSGSAGQTLDVSAVAAALPAALANNFVAGLDAAGTLDGSVHVGGGAADPVVDFDAHLAGAESSQTRRARTGPLDLAAKGSYSQAGGVSLRQATVTGEGISASAAGTVKPVGDGDAILNLDADVTSLPAALANAYVAGLDAAGTLSGTANVGGSVADPAVRFDAKLAGVETSQTRQAKTGPLDLVARGRYSKADGVSLRQATVSGRDISASASGTVKPAGGNVFALDLDANVGSLPAALANAYVQNLDAVGALSGTFQVGGTTTDPSVHFDAKLAGAETSQTRQAALGPFDLSAAGSYSKAQGVALDHASVQGEKISGKAAGTINPNGPSDFSLDLASTGAALPLSLGSAESPIDLAVQALSLKVSGEKTAAKLDGSASIASVATKDVKVDNLAASLHSEGFDLDGRIGPFTAKVTADSVGLDNPTVAPLIAGKITANVAGSLEKEAVTIGSGSVHGDALNGAVAGSISLSGGAIDLHVDADALSAALPAAARGVLGERTKISAALKRDANGNISADPVKLSSGALSADGAASLADGKVSANMKGELADVSLLSKDAQGAIGFAIKASGPSAAPDLSLDVDSDRLVVAGREITGLKLGATGKADLANPAASVSLSGMVAGQKLQGSAVLKTAGGKRTINGLSLSLGPNRISGDLALDDVFLPDGTISLDLPDIGPLAALALEKAEGDVRGTIKFSKQDGLPQIAVKANTEKLTRGDLSARHVAIDALIVDYLKTPTISGTIKAAGVTSGGTAITGIDVDLKRDGEWTGFSGGATIKDIPAKAKGRVKVADGTTTVELSSGQATFQGILATIAQPSTITVKDGTTTIGRLGVGIGGGIATVTGTVGQALDINVALAGVPVAVANNFSPGLDAAGSVSGTVKVIGAASSPSVAYDINGTGIALAQTRGAGFGGMSVASSGTFAADKLTFNATVSEGSGASLKAGGTVTTAGAPNLDIKASGSVPFGFLAAKLAAQGLSLSGTANVDVSVRGPASAPQIGGSVTTSGARFIDAKSGLAVNDISADVALGGGVATIKRLTGTLSTRGTLSVGGTVGIDPAGGFPADLSIKLANGRYTDGRVVTANLDGDLTVKGQLVSAPVIAGTVNLGKTVITVPERLPSSLSTLDVKHKNAPAAVRAQDKALRPASASGNSGGGGLALDLTVHAPNQIFVQGRGLDAELGGTLKLTGPASAPQAVGQFKLERGRLSILGKRLTFTEGTLTFSGSLVPYLNLTAQSTATDATVTITVSGEATNPKFSFSSVPALPEDEVLARLIFGRSMSNLSPLQIAQLAEAAAQLTGVGGSTSLLEKLRSQLGVDDLDVTTDEQGGTAVSAGKYLNDRTYLNIQKGEKPGSGRARIDFNVGKGVKLRGEASDSGEAKGGIFYEKEY